MPTKRISITRYQQDYFEPGDAPVRNTIIGWINNGTLDGIQMGPPGSKGKRGGKWYLSPDRKPIARQGEEKLKSLLEEFDAEVLSYDNGKAA